MRADTALKADTQAALEVLENHDVTLPEVIFQFYSLKDKDVPLQQKAIAFWLSMEQMLVDPEDEFDKEPECPLCHGSGGVPPEMPCIQCKGKGHV